MFVFDFPRRILNVVVLLILFPIFIASTPHKFYVSTTMIEYVQEQNSVQIITKIFIDDVEDVLQKRHGESVSLDSTKETEADANYLRDYILQKLIITLDGEVAKLNYLGKEYDSDIVKSYIEIVDVATFDSIEIENKLLLDMFEEQKNIIHVKASDQRRSLILVKENSKGTINFN